MRGYIKIEFDEATNKCKFKGKNCSVVDLMASAGMLIEYAAKESNRPITEVLRDFRNMVLCNTSEIV